MHVDRRETHAVSVITEVGQLSFGTQEADPPSWPLHILDHDGKKHTVPNRPGSFILYESATCPHGRPERFPGREVAHVFTHFAPKGWPEAYVNGAVSTDLVSGGCDGFDRLEL